MVSCAKMFEKHLSNVSLLAELLFSNFFFTGMNHDSAIQGSYISKLKLCPGAKVVVSMVITTCLVFNTHYTAIISRRKEKKRVPSYNIIVFVSIFPLLFARVREMAFPDDLKLKLENWADEVLSVADAQLYHFLKSNTFTISPRKGCLLPGCSTLIRFK